MATSTYPNILENFALIAYRPLISSTREIRLLTLLPAVTAQESFAPADLIHCQLDHYPIDLAYANSPLSPPRHFYWGSYNALSYTWGSPIPPATIIVNTHPVTVTPNLEAALRQLRSNPEYTGPNSTKLWVDSLCINQTDIPERNREVKRMKTIYSCAATPVLWLGPAADDSDLAMEAVSALNAATTYSSNENSTVLLTQAPLVQTLMHLQPGVWAALYHLFTRAYWSRIWIIQEISQGQDTLPVLCGTKTVMWKTLHTAMLVLYNDQITAARLIEADLGRDSKDLASRGFSRIGTIERCRLACMKGQSVDILKILDSLPTSNSTDPRDKLYALVGIEGFSRVVDINPDYEASVEDAVMTFQRSLVEKGGSLESLRLTGRLGKGQGMPSWCLNILNERPRSLLTNDKARFMASNGRRATVHFKDEGRRLTCRGIKLDTVYSTSGNPRTTVRTSHDEDGLQPRSMYPKEEIASAIWRTLVSDRTHRRAQAPSEWSAILSVPFMRLVSHSSLSSESSFARAASFSIAGEPLTSYFGRADYETEEASPEMVARYILVVDRIFPGRVLATTSRGYLALVPEESIVGDSIYILIGCTTPIVLRSVADDLRRIIGESYVHGVMEGEVFRGWEQEFGDAEADNVVIC